MKMQKVVMLLIVAFALCVGNASASVAVTDLPTTANLNDFVSDFNAGSGDYITSISSAAEKLGYTYDIWNNGEMISFYAQDSGAKNGYRSMYLNSNGEKITPSCGVSYTATKSYEGNVNDVKTEESTTSENNVSEKSSKTYDDLVSDLQDFSDLEFCTSEKCANYLSGKLNEKGWGTTVVTTTIDGKDLYVVKVTTTDKGTFYLNGYSE